MKVFRKSCFFIFPVLFVVFACSNSESVVSPTKNKNTVNWTSAADSSIEGMILNYWNPQEHYFNTNNQGNTRFQYWPQAHALDVLVRAYVRTNDTKYLQYINQWYDGVKSQTGDDFQNNFNDDMEWNALAMVRVYKATGDQKFKEAAINVWQEIKTGWTNVAGGGIMWQDNTPANKNTPANAPACILASMLYQIDQKESNLKWAKKIYNWEKNNLVNIASGEVYDGLHILSDGSIDVNKDWQFTYNQGTFIGAALKLYQITGKRIYLHDAIKTADFTLNTLVNVQDRLLKDEGDGDGGLFKGIFVRYFTKLILSPDLSDAVRQRYITFLQHNAKTLWLEGTNKTYVTFGTYWKKKPGNTVDLKTDLSGVILMERAAQLYNEGFFEDN